MYSQCFSRAIHFQKSLEKICKLYSCCTYLTLRQNYNQVFLKFEVKSKQSFHQISKYIDEIERIFMRTAMWVRMTTLVEHRYAQPRECSFLPKNLMSNVLNKLIMGCIWADKNRALFLVNKVFQKWMNQVMTLTKNVLLIQYSTQICRCINTPVKRQYINALFEMAIYHKKRGSNNHQLLVIH